MVQRCREWATDTESHRRSSDCGAERSGLAVSHRALAGVVRQRPRRRERPRPGGGRERRPQPPIGWIRQRIESSVNTLKDQLPPRTTRRTHPRRTAHPHHRTHPRPLRLHQPQPTTRTRRPHTDAIHRLTDQPSRRESSINGSIPTATWTECKEIRKEKPRVRGFCRAL